MTAVNKISDLKVERYLLGELGEEEMSALQKREAEDEIFAARVRALREENARILRDNPFAGLESKLEESVARTGACGEEHAGLGTLWLKVAAALVVAVGVFLMVTLNRDVSTYDAPNATMEVAMAGEGAAPEVADTRIKGLGVRIEVWKKTADSAVQMSNLDEAHEGDEIQLRYSVPEKCFGMLFSIDGNGTVTMHMADENRAVELAPGKMTTLPFAYKLDNAPKFETFYLLTSDEEFSIDASDIDATFKRKGVRQEHLTLRKVEK
jgi:hypothetical protein